MYEDGIKINSLLAFPVLLKSFFFQLVMHVHFSEYCFIVPNTHQDFHVNEYLKKFRCIKCVTTL